MSKSNFIPAVENDPDDARVVKRAFETADLSGAAFPFLVMGTKPWKIPQVRIRNRIAPGTRSSIFSLRLT